MGQVTYKEVLEDNKLVIKEYHKIKVHSFAMGDVDDPDLYAAQPLWEWQQSDPGKFVMENSIEEPVFHRMIDQYTYGYRYTIVAVLEKKKLSEFYMKWGIPTNNNTF